MGVVVDEEPQIHQCHGQEQPQHRGPYFSQLSRPHKPPEGSGGNAVAEHTPRGCSGSPRAAGRGAKRMDVDQPVSPLPAEDVFERTW